MAPITIRPLLSVGSESLTRCSASGVDKISHSSEEAAIRFDEEVSQKASSIFLAADTQASGVSEVFLKMLYGVPTSHVSIPHGIWRQGRWVYTPPESGRHDGNIGPERNLGLNTNRCPAVPLARLTTTHP
jgi:hypothetical protein